MLLIPAGVAGFLSHRHRAEAEANAERAQHSSDETPESIGRRYVANGARLLDEGDNFGALVWFVEALKLHRGIANEETNDRLRIGSVLRQSPKLLQVWCPGGPINSAEFSQDGHLVLATVGTNAVWVWNTETGKAEHSPLMHKGNRPVEAHFSPDGQTIVSVNGDSASLWSMRTGDRLRTLAHMDVYHAAFDSEGALLATASRDGSVKIWSLGNSGGGARVDALCTLPHKKPIVSLCFSPDSKGLLTAEEGGSVHIWDLGEGQSASATERLPAWRPEGGLRYAAFDLDGSRVVTVHAGGTARIWDGAIGSAMTPVLRESNGLTHATFSPDGRWLAT
ncbi:MAG TPA: hypothetical protein VKM56_10195, partial [Verrucomicrobiae bacterium]|nr:hypothetical protein [Verrucomicrobiae bacterium]